jgi:uncharacterized protein with HEPN domain
MFFQPREYLRHILAEADYLLDSSRNLSRERFLADETLKRAFVRSLEIIGEAAKKLPEGFRGAHPGAEWRAMAGMRDRLIHGYFGVDYDLVWDVVHTKVPALKREIERILKSS